MRTTKVAIGESGRCRGRNCDSLGCDCSCRWGGFRCNVLTSQDILREPRNQLSENGLVGGEGGIRTHVGITSPTRFRVEPVMTTSVPLRADVIWRGDFSWIRGVSPSGDTRLVDGDGASHTADEMSRDKTTVKELAGPGELPGQFRKEPCSFRPRDARSSASGISPSPISSGPRDGRKARWYPGRPAHKAGGRIRGTQ